MMSKLSISFFIACLPVQAKKYSQNNVRPESKKRKGKITASGACDCRRFANGRI